MCLIDVKLGYRANVCAFVRMCVYICEDVCTFVRMCVYICEDVCVHLWGCVYICEDVCMCNRCIVVSGVKLNNH
jgi:hypothetical protein